MDDALLRMARATRDEDAWLDAVAVRLPQVYKAVYSEAVSEVRGDVALEERAATERAAQGGAEGRVLQRADHGDQALT